MRVGEKLSFAVQIADSSTPHTLQSAIYCFTDLERGHFRLLGVCEKFPRVHVRQFYEESKQVLSSVQVTHALSDMLRFDTEDTNAQGTAKLEVVNL